MMNTTMKPKPGLNTKSSGVKIEFPFSKRFDKRQRLPDQETTARLKLRKRKDIDTGMRVLFDGQTFQIVSPPKPDNENGRIYMTLELSLVE